MAILCYHSVEPEWASPLAVGPDAFRAHCRWLARRRGVVPLEQAVSKLDRSLRLPAGITAVTFDDGFASLYTHAYPALAARAIPWTVFLVAETLTPTGRPGELSDVLARLVASPELRARLGRSARARAEERFDVPLLRARLRDLYEPARRG